MLKTTALKSLTLAAGVMLASGSAYAGETMASVKETQDYVEAAKESCISGDIGVVVVSQYISRGLVFEGEGLIVQPFADLYFKLYEGEGALTSVQLNLGIWSSLHSEKTDAGAVTGAGTSTTENWYEFDYTVGMAFTFMKSLTITPSFYSFISPNDGFDTFYGANLKVAYDDSELWGGGFALNPYAQVLFELENKAGNGPDEGIYYEFGIAPKVPLGPVGVSFPFAVGLGSDDFYADDETFGFASGGIALSYDLTFIPECYGTWTLTGGATYYYLGDALKDFNTANRRGGDGDDSEVVFSGGLTVAF